MSDKKIRPKAVFADARGNIFDHPDLEMVARHGADFAQPRPDEFIPLPPESELFLLPGRHALGMDPETGKLEAIAEDADGNAAQAVAAFAAPGHTLTGIAAYETLPGAPTLPLFAYGAVGWGAGRFWIAAKKVDEDPRQIFTGVPKERIAKNARRLLAQFPKNRLVQHLMGCALTSCCPAARNLSLGRYEAPLPVSRTCNAACVGCLSHQPEDSGFPSTQNRIAFTPTPEEIAEVMALHASRESKPILSFGQGCEGEPLTEWKLIRDAIALYRSRSHTGGGIGTVNVNTNASLPEAVAPLAQAGLTSMRVSLNSADPALHAAYYRPKGFTLADVRASIREAKANKLFVSLNLLFFPGITDAASQYDALATLIAEDKPDFIQLRNLNLDPELYLSLASPHATGPVMGFLNFRKRLKREFDWLKFGYFNPWVEGQ